MVVDHEHTLPCVTVRDLDHGSVPQLHHRRLQVSERHVDLGLGVVHLESVEVVVEVELAVGVCGGDLVAASSQTGYRAQEDNVEK